MLAIGADMPYGVQVRAALLLLLLLLPLLHPLIALPQNLFIITPFIAALAITVTIITTAALSLCSFVRKRIVCYFWAVDMASYVTPFLLFVIVVTLCIPSLSVLL